MSRSATTSQLDDLLTSMSNSNVRDSVESDLDFDSYYGQDHTPTLGAPRCLACKGADADSPSADLCMPCYRERYLPQCRKCKEPIEGRAIGSGDGKVRGRFHPSCFTCFSCDAAFPDGDVRREQGRN